MEWLYREMPSNAPERTEIIPPCIAPAGKEGPAPTFDYHKADSGACFPITLLFRGKEGTFPINNHSAEEEARNGAKGHPKRFSCVWKLLVLTDIPRKTAFCKGSFVLCLFEACLSFWPFWQSYWSLSCFWLLCF